MPELHYGDALKRGQKAYHACVSKGQHPYLPVMDDMISKESAMSGANIGLVSIPVGLIFSTKTRGRTNAFAQIFMPLLAENSEFAHK